MTDHPPDPEKNEADYYLRQVTDAYVFDTASGIYKPKSESKAKNSTHKPDDANKKPRILVEVKRDRLALVVGILTLLVVALYTYYARQQWREMKRTVHEATRAAEQAALSAAAAQDAIRLSKEQFTESQRPYVWLVNGENIAINGAVSGKPLNVTLKYQNYGLSPALLVRTAIDFEIGPNAKTKLHRGKWDVLTSVLPPGKSDPYSAESSTPLTTSNQLRDRDSVAVYAVFQFTNVARHLYETDICFYVEPNGMPVYCAPNQNDIKDCEKDKCSQ